MLHLVLKLATMPGIGPNLDVNHFVQENDLCEPGICSKSCANLYSPTIAIESFPSTPTKLFVVEPLPANLTFLEFASEILLVEEFEGTLELIMLGHARLVWLVRTTCVLVCS